MDFHDFQAIRYLTEIDWFDENGVDPADGDCSDDRWEDDEPLTVEEVADEGPAYPEHNNIACVCRVRTRAQARMADDDSDDMDGPGARLPDLPAAASPPHTRRKKITRTARQAPPMDASTTPDVVMANDPLLLDEVVVDEDLSVDGATMRPTPSAKPDSTRPNKPVGRPRLDKGPTIDEIVELQKQQGFLKGSAPCNWTDAEIAHTQKQDKDVAKLRQWVRDKHVPL